MIAECAFWAASSFPYVSAMSLLNSTIPVLMISVFVGIFLGLVYDLRSLFTKW